ncbi:MAG: aldose epimerase family protein [Pirellulales bacterium]
MSLETITLTDPATGSTATILAGFGFNCFRFRAVCGGEPVEVLWSEPGFESGGKRASGSGIPVLFPFVGRIHGTRFEFQGKQYSLEAGDGLGNAIHGFVLDRPWRVTECSPTRVVGQFQASVDAPDLLDRWPADFRITLGYELAGNTLRCQVDIQNPDQRPLPFGLGTHPYFRVPLGAAGDAARCRVTVPATKYWELAGMLPTGRVLPAEGSRSIRDGMEFGRTAFDDVFAGLEFTNRTCTARIDDAVCWRTLTMTFGDEFQECVVYNPPHRESICIEPYTCVPDAFSLLASGVDAGLRILSPGASFRARVEMSVEGA